MYTGKCAVADGQFGSVSIIGEEEAVDAASRDDGDGFGFAAVFGGG
ncbi:hypothetical protein [Mycobacteroides abscessus]|nr:hypothetical protein [Mycobacteroides abscessus]